MVNLVKDYLPINKKIQLVVIKKNLKFLEKNFKINYLRKKTRGQADTVKQALTNVAKQKTIFINSCDTFSLFNINLYKTLKKKSDILVFASKNEETDSVTSEGSWVKLKNYKIKKVLVKKPKVFGSLRLTGNFYFKNKKVFLKCFEQVIKKNSNKKELLIDDLVKEGVKMKLKVNCITDDVYVNMGTPKLLKEFNYWENYFND